MRWLLGGAFEMGTIMPSPIDWRALLIKYIRHVGSEEGTSFIGSAMVDLKPGWRLSDNEFTKAEKAALVACDQESCHAKVV